MGAIDTLPINEQIETIYLGYLGRAADSGGLAFWEGQYTSALATAPAGTPTQMADYVLNNIANSFTPQAETLSIYPFLATPVDLLTTANLDTLVNQIYENLFDRAAQTGDLSYWVPLLQHGTIYLGNAVIAIANGAIGTDLTSLDNKITVASDFSSETGAVGIGNGYEDQALSQIFKTEAHQVLVSVTSNPESVTEALAAIAAFVANGGTALTGPGPGPGATFALTVGQDVLTGYGSDVFNAYLAAPAGGQTVDQPTLTSGDSLTEISPATGAVLNAYFDGSANVTGVNIEGIATWNISQESTAVGATGTVNIVGDGVGEPAVISGLTTLNYNANTTETSLNLGTNYQPINVPSATDNYTGTPANGFAINVSDAMGGYSVGVDVDMWSGDFTGHDTIFVTALNVGLFPIDSSGSPDVTPEILVRWHDGDDYDPNWVGYLGNSYSIAAGSTVSSAPAIGFQTWVVTSENTGSGLNIIALGGDGSTNATTLDLLNPPLTVEGSAANTILFATAISDSLSTDWENLATIDLSQTRGFVTLTGLETNIQELTDWGFLHAFTLDEAINYFGSLSNALAYEFGYWEGGGLLTSDTTALMSIVGGTGNSFYDLSSLTLATAEAGSFQGGSSTHGNSEIAFNNYVMTEGGAANGGTTPFNISNVSILDDVSATFPMTVPTNIYSGAGGSSTATLPDNGEAQGGVINMNNFDLQPLNVNYGLLAEDLLFNGGEGAPNPYGLPFTEAQYLYTPPASQAALLPATLAITFSPTYTLTAVEHALDLQNGVVPAGFQLLQFLNADGSTQTVLGADLTVYDNFVHFAINAQDLGDGYDVPPQAFLEDFGIPTPANGNTDIEGDYYYGLSSPNTYNYSDGSVDLGLFTLQGFDMTFWAFAPPSTTVNTSDTLDLFVSDDGAFLLGYQELEVNLLYVSTVFSSLGDPSVSLPVDLLTFGTALYVPHFTVDNVTTVNIAIPYESLGLVEFHYSDDTFKVLDLANYVILGASLLSVPNSGHDGSFTDQPVVTVPDATVNFFDNHADNGGSPPGGPDNLVLGDTNFTDLLVPIPDVLATALPFTLFPAAIGYTSVFIDATTAADGSATTTINDFGTGSFEIGATNATNLNAQSTSHLIMDLPGTLDYVGSSYFDQGEPATGITVNGSLLGQNLLQGTSGIVEFDFLYGHVAPINPYGFVVNLGVYETQIQADGANGGWGNDSLTGGEGWGTAITYSTGGVTSTIYTLGVSNAAIDGGYTNGPGNTGDNFFPEGGLDVVNISAAEKGVLTGTYEVFSSSGTVLLQWAGPYDNESTVWVGFYDVCNSAGPNASFNGLGFPNSGVGTVLAQAVTDINDLGLTFGYSVEMFVDGYGNSPGGFSAGYDNPAAPTSDWVTINGFHFGGTGDTIVFDPGDWASTLAGTLTNPGIPNGGGGYEAGTILGLVATDGNTLIGFNLGTELGRGGDGVVISSGGLLVPPNGPYPDLAYDYIADNIGGVIPNASALAHDLASGGTDIILSGTGVAAYTQVDMLVAYTTGTSINIADVNMTNTTSSAITDTQYLHITAHDLVHITTTLGLSNLVNNTHNLWFIG